MQDENLRGALIQLTTEVNNAAIAAGFAGDPGTV
jgi:hypothetical protein